MKSVHTTPLMIEKITYSGLKIDLSSTPNSRLSMLYPTLGFVSFFDLPQSSDCESSFIMYILLGLYAFDSLSCSL